MKVQILILCAALLQAGCAAHIPTWSRANARQRAEGDFIEDEAYLASPECEAQVQASAEIIVHLRR